MALNKNNFIRMTGRFTKPNFSITPGNSTFTLYATEDSVVIQPLLTCAASLGINPASFKVLFTADTLGNLVEMSRDCFWDGVANLTVYRPVDLALTDVIIGFTFDDYDGNNCGPIGSNPVVDVIISPITTEWVAYPGSAYCTLDGFGNNTGYLAWTQLKLQNSTTHTDISPLTLKDNVVSDADYIAPITNHIACPVVGIGDYAPLFISNFSRNGSNPTNYIVITSIYLASTNLGPGATPIILNIPCNIQPGNTQRFNVPSGNWDTGLTITYTINGDMVSAAPQRYWKVNAAGVISGWNSGGPTTHPIDNSAIYGNFTITIPATSDGITIFAQ